MLNELMEGEMNLLGNIIWFVFGGLISAVGWAVSGMLLFVTIIGIPFGMQCFKIAGLVLWPFGKHLEIGEFGDGGLIGNVIWVILLGWELSLNHLIWAFLFGVTIIGLPFAKQHLRCAMLALMPFGARVY